MNVTGIICSMKANASHNMGCSAWCVIFAALAVVPLAVSPPEASFDMPPPQSAFSRCIDKAGGITSNLMDCNGLEQERLDRLLDEAYRRALEKLSPERQKQLAISQIKWLEKSDLVCQNDPDVKEFEGGSFAMVLYATCIQGETVSRTTELEQKYLN